MNISSVGDSSTMECYAMLTSKSMRLGLSPCLPLQGQAGCLPRRQTVVTA